MSVALRKAKEACKNCPEKDYWKCRKCANYWLVNPDVPIPEEEKSSKS